MYHYIYDSFLSDIKYSKVLTVIENRLIDLGLQGRIDKLTLFKDPRELIVGGVKKWGVKNVVAVGNDQTLNKVVNAADGQNVTIGMIPIGPQNEIAKILGIDEGAASCDCLSNRLIKTIDLGKINGHYFLSSLRTNSSEVNLRFGNSYRVKLIDDNEVTIYNLPAFCKKADPQDGYLEAYIRPINKKFSKQFIKTRESFFPAKKIFLESEKEFPVFVDGLKINGTTAEIQILPKKLKMIVGKNRLF